MPEVKNLVANIPFVTNIRNTDHPVYFRLKKDFFNAPTERSVQGQGFSSTCARGFGSYFDTPKILQPVEIKKTI